MQQEVVPEVKVLLLRMAGILTREACPQSAPHFLAFGNGIYLADLETGQCHEERGRQVLAARANGFVHNEAIANELAARFHAARGFAIIANAYLRDAWSCYLRWGADGKVRHLESLHPFLREPESTRAAAATIAVPIEHLDFATVVKVSQAVSGEMMLDKLIDALMRLAIEHAGAERGLLLLSRGNDLRQEAEATTSGDGIIVRRQDEAAAALPDSIVHYVMRSREIMLLDDASAHPTYSSDSYVRAPAALRRRISVV
jgi:GAF domain-containing protein